MPDDTRGDTVEPALPAGSRFEGVLLAAGPARIDGRLRGQVICEASLEIGPEAAVEGPVEAAEIVVAGEVRGDLVASRRILLASTARVTGNIAAPRLAAADGAKVDGQVRVAQPGSRAEAPAAP